MDGTITLVIIEAVAIGFLGLLVAGLLRSHAEILRQLHQLGVGQEPVAGAPAVRPPLAAPAPVAAVDGVTPTGDAVHIVLDRPGERTVLLFLSSGCGTCGPLWAGMRAGEHTAALPGVRVLAVTRGDDAESPGALVGLAPADVVVVMSSAAWEAFRVPGAPYAVMIGDGGVMGEGMGRTWHQLGSLVGQHLADVGARPLDGAARERRADQELLAAGIHPGHPSLYPS